MGLSSFVSNSNYPLCAWLKVLLIPSFQSSQVDSCLCFPFLSTKFLFFVTSSAKTHEAHYSVGALRHLFMSGRVPSPYLPTLAPFPFSPIHLLSQHLECLKQRDGLSSSFHQKPSPIFSAALLLLTSLDERSQKRAPFPFTSVNLKFSFEMAVWLESRSLKVRLRLSGGIQAPRTRERVFLSSDTSFWVKRFYFATSQELKREPWGVRIALVSM